MKRLLLALACVSIASLLPAQAPDNEPATIALDYIHKQYAAWGLDQSDISSLRITDMYTSKHNGVTHVYYIQQYNGIDIPQGTFGAHVQNGRVFFAGDRLIKNIDAKIIAGKPALTAEHAVSKTLSELGSAVRGPLAVRKQVGANQLIFQSGAHALQDFPVRLAYVQSDDQLVLAWEVTIEPAPAGDLWSVSVDARTGDIVSKRRLTIYCAFPDHYLANPHSCAGHELEAESIQSMTMTLPAGDGAQYNVVAVPDESPNHGPRQMVIEPADVDASPQGWHDTDGIAGAEFTTTRGNNVHAFLDRNADSNADATTEGGSDLVFDFEYDPMLEPTEYQHAATTNLFYMNNIMHDFTYHYGFDEFSGNFQETNHTGLGVDGDFVIAHAQYGADLVEPPLNNATFGTPGDGGSGRMRMYLWSRAGGARLLRVESPAEVAGSYQTTTTSEWGGIITATPLTGEVAIVSDGSGSASQGCNNLVNEGDVAGKFALIDRGNCEFGRKALRAQTAGAIGFIICNFEEGYINMGAGADGAQVTIPGVFISYSDCQKIRVFAGTGLTVSFVNESAGTGPAQRDGSLDNNVIAHEFGHGVSNRLTGGPANAGCLFNYDHNNDGTTEDGEQMGEGWSDFFALVTSVRPGDTKETARGIATYASGQDTNGVGLRSYAYSTDMLINPLTYDDIAFQSVPHGIGTVWSSVLWDLYWALTEEYGYDPDLYRGTGGNNLAIQLVMDGMKLQVCNPGLVDGRDAILAADLALTGGANQLLIWQVFARRGLGFSADQGEDRFRHDNTEAFDLSPFVVKELKIVKHMTPFIERGETVDVELWAVNHKESDATDVVVTDVLPEGTTFVTGSANHAFDIQGDVMMFEIGALASGDTTKITYQISTEPSLFSKRYFKDDVEGDFYWDAVIEDWPVLQWQTQSLVVNSGSVAWGVENIDTIIDQNIVLLDPVSLPGVQPALIFYHNYETERFFDAGIVQISDDAGFTWHTPGPENIVRGDYTGKVPFALFAIPRLKAWHGKSDGWVQTVVDLSEYAGKDVFVRFRFASDGNTSGVGWFIDDIELVDLFNYNSEACISSVEGDEACAEAARKGTIVASDMAVSTDDPSEASFDLNVFPNPARNFVTVDITSEHAQQAEITLVNNAGQMVWSERTDIPAGTYSHSVDTRNLPEGFYFIRVQGERDQAIRKIVVQ